MHRAVLTLLVGLILALGGGANASDMPSDTLPEELYGFALSKAISNDLEGSEAAFREFLKKYPEHSRNADT